jgi:hypothetical protein
MCITAIWLSSQAPVNSTQPEISYIERFGSNQVLIHFDTDPNRTYILQYTSSLAGSNWSNLYTGYNYPFSEHYVIPDTRTNGSRFYRLKVTTP